jgi:hypothetical protein
MSQMLYLNSVESVYDSVEKYYRFTLPRPITTDNKSMSLRLVECEIPITYFNIITDYNNEFNFRVQGVKDGVTDDNYYKLTIPQKNYSVQEMLVELNALIVSDGAIKDEITTSMTFNSQTLRFSINCVSSTTRVISLIDIRAGGTNFPLTTSQKVLGFNTDDSIIPNATSGSLEFSNSINMNRTKNIYIMTNNLGLNTMTNSNNNKLSILSKVQASQPFGSIVSYQSESDNYITINPQITYIDHVDLYLLDDEGADLYLNGVNWCVSLVFQEGIISNSVSTFEPNRTLTQLSM